MAISLSLSCLHNFPSPEFIHKNSKLCGINSNFVIYTRIPFPNLNKSGTLTTFRRGCPCKSSNFSKAEEPSVNSQVAYDNGGNKIRGENTNTFSGWLSLIQSLLPGGSWWNLQCDGELEAESNSLSVLQALQRMWMLMADCKGVLYTALFALTVAVLSEISIPNIMATAIFSAQRGELTAFYRNSQLLLFLCITSGICSGLRNGCFAAANVIMVKRLRETVSSALVVQDILFYETEGVGNLTSRLAADCQRLSNTIANDLHLVLRNVLQGTGAIINLLLLSWPLGLSALFISSILSAIFLVYGQYQKQVAKITQEFAATTNEVTQETLSLIRIVRAYGTEKQELQRFVHCLNDLASIGLRESTAYGLWNLSFNALYRLTQVLAVVLGGMSFLSGHLPAEKLTKYVLYCEWLTYAVWRLQDNWSSLFQSVGAGERVFSMMDLLPSDQFLSEGVKLQRLTGEIKFVDISFHYPSRTTVPVLSTLNIHVQANEFLAIVGPSGCGKSTLISLLLRLYDPTEGEILIDGVPLMALDIRWLRERVAFVGQEPHLFHFDIKSNISYGCFSPKIGQEDIERAAKQACAHDFISSLPNRYETIVDDHLLSGGQKQRIAIARAMLRDPALLILDEATSALDFEIEYNVVDMIHSWKRDSGAERTVIVIAHRLSTVKAADRIIVMDGGKVIEMGDHQHLLSKNGVYARLVKLQNEFVC